MVIKRWKHSFSTVFLRKKKEKKNNTVFNEHVWNFLQVEIKIFSMKTVVAQEHFYLQSTFVTLTEISSVLWKHSVRICTNTFAIESHPAAWGLQHTSFTMSHRRKQFESLACFLQQAVPEQLEKKQTLPENNTRKAFPCFSDVQLNKKHRLWEVPVPIRKSQDKHQNMKWQLSTV